MPSDALGKESGTDEPVLQDNRGWFALLVHLYEWTIIIFGGRINISYQELTITHHN